MKVEGSLALVTGGSAGIGLQISVHLLREGALVVIMDLDDRRGREVVAELTSTFGAGRVHFERADVTDSVRFAQAFRDGKAAFGRKQYNVAVMNAGIAEHPQYLWDLSSTRWKRVIDVDLTAVIDGARHAVADMVAGGEPGVVINVASMAGLLPTAHPVYAAAKAGVVHFSRSLVPPSAAVRVNALCPSFVDTALVSGAMQQDPAFGLVVAAAGGAMTADVVASAAVRLVQDDSLRNVVMRVTQQNGVDFQKYTGMAAIKPPAARL